MTTKEYFKRRNDTERMLRGENAGLRADVVDKRAVAEYRAAMLDIFVPAASDATASLAVSAYPGLTGDGSLVKAGTRINWQGQLKRAASDLWDRADNWPDAAPTLWEDINYRGGYRVIPDVVTAGLAFGKGERGWWKDKLYESLIDSNVWTPAAYAAGWKVVAL